MLYPLTFVPRFKERLWGGRAIADLYHKPLPAGVPVGESWEICDRPGEASVIANGPLAGRDLRWLMAEQAVPLLGFPPRPGTRFPLLVKILDAREILSVQVHPPAAVAEQLGGEPKTEMWYVTRASRGAALSAGLRRGVTREQFEQGLAAGTVADCIHQVPVTTGDAMFLPSGRVHALGAGMVIFEIQQNSDTTYRVFDWNRVGPDGRPRELHIAPALECIDFTDVEPRLIASSWEASGAVHTRPLVEHALFTVHEHHAAQATCRAWTPGRPCILGVVCGTLTVRHPASGIDVPLEPGGFCLLPASLRGVTLVPAANTDWLAATPGTAE